MKTKLFLFFLLLVAATQLKANNMLVKNVTTTGDNVANKTIQVQFDMSWDNSWRDAINWDAAWVFMKYKDANGLWQHVQLNTTGFANGTGTANTIQVGSDKVGAFVYRSVAGTGTFGATTIQLQWNYGLSGLTSVTGLEVRVFAVEMVYVPQGDFTIAPTFTVYKENNYDNVLLNFYAPGNNIPVINNRLSPTLTYYDLTNTATVRIKGDAGIDTDNNGTVDVTNYPTGYNAFYCYKYELTEQQYADFLNTLTEAQKTTLGVAGTNIKLTNGDYFSSSPTKACGNSTPIRLLAFADWSGVRPMTILEFNKASYGPLFPISSQTYNYINQRYHVFYPIGVNYNSIRGVWNSDIYNVDLSKIIEVGSYAKATSSRLESGGTYYGMMDFTGNVMEPCVNLPSYTFTNANGNGVLGTTGATDVTTWQNPIIIYIEQSDWIYNSYGNLTHGGFRYVRSAE